MQLWGNALVMNHYVTMRVGFPPKELEQLTASCPPKRSVMRQDIRIPGLGVRLPRSPRKDESWGPEDSGAYELPGGIAGFLLEGREPMARHRLILCSLYHSLSLYPHWDSIHMLHLFTCNVLRDYGERCSTTLGTKQYRGVWFLSYSCSGGGSGQPWALMKRALPRSNHLTTANYIRGSCQNRVLEGLAADTHGREPWGNIKVLKHSRGYSGWGVLTDVNKTNTSQTI